MGSRYMKHFNFADMKGGWFVGDFSPSAFRTNAVEVCYKHHPVGERWPTHFHALATEINLLVRGSMRLNDTDLKLGDIFILEPGELATPEFLSNCELVVVKVPSIPGDKHLR